MIEKRAAPDMASFTAAEAIAELKHALYRKEIEFLDLKCTYLSTRLKSSSESLKNAKLSTEIALLNDKNEKMEGILESTKRRLQTCELQLLEAKSLQSKLREDLLREREQLRMSKKKESELENYVKGLERELRDLRAVRETTPKNCLRPRKNATTYQCMGKSRENADAGEALPKIKTRRPLMDRTNVSQKDADSADSKDEKQ
ncbi:unnamed protein product [Cylicocyclus nassatus]|uniref:Uncharacterized protein n=1 Tax=Cylicocyclus nassatus TaxID=53992 RepID=A0AA36MIC5_CYLNA|nr:unnamed protein product [Cylicocyclus nassatus]